LSSERVLKKTQRHEAAFGRNHTEEGNNQLIGTTAATSRVFFNAENGRVEK
jgi:hypothetical protein